MAQEFSTWPVQLETDVTVGPVTVPFALDLVALADFVQQKVDVEPQVEAEAAPVAPEKAPVEGPRSLRWARRARKLVEVDEAKTARSQSHVLVELLRDADYYHASALLEGARQRAKGLLLTAERHAEIQLLRRMGWLVICARSSDATVPHDQEEV